MAKKQDDESTNTNDSNVDSTISNGNIIESKPVITTTTPVELVKSVRYRNVTNHKVEVAFQKEYFVLRTGEDIVIPADQEVNFINEHGRTNFFKRVD